jgi:hypothetical protein
MFEAGLEQKQLGAAMPSADISIIGTPMNIPSLPG